MIRVRRLATALFTALLSGPWISGQSRGPVQYEFKGGKWFDGKGFVSRTFYTIDGKLTTKRPSRVDAVMDLSGKYVIPPFGEAHNHNVEHSSRINALIQSYLDAGIYYVKNPNNLHRTKAPLEGKVNVPQSIDAVFAGGGLTASGGHPADVAARNIDRGIWSNADGEGAFYFTIDQPADLDQKWPTILARHPNFIKTYLLYSEEYAKRKDSASYLYWRGLDPALLPEIVRQARRAGLRVSTHVETAVDFHHAAAAGVDEINHLPGFRPDHGDPASYDDPTRYEIAESDARLAAQNHVVVVTTISGTLSQYGKPEPSGPQAKRAEAIRNLMSRNLRLLAKHRVTLAIGSDRYRDTALPEAMGLHGLSVFDNLALLKMWCENTPKAIFPGRKIGELKEGWEANFLVLDGDPIADFMNVKTIRLRIKQGEVISLPGS